METEALQSSWATVNFDTQSDVSVQPMVSQKIHLPIDIPFRRDIS